MIKRILSILFFVLMVIRADAQKIRLDSIRWINKDLGHLYFENGRVNFNFVGYDKSKSRYAIVKDTLIMSDVFTTSADNFKVKHKTDYKFQIRNLTSARLYLKAIDSNAVSIAGNITYEFTNFKNSYDKDVKFSKLRFLSSTCHDGCPQLEISITADGEYHLRGGEYAEPYKGEFAGKLTAKQLDTLNYWLKHSELKKMTNWQQADTVADAPNYYFEIAFENTKKNLSIITNQPPMNIADLVQFMMLSYKNITLSPVKK